MPGICVKCLQLDMKLQDANLQIKSMNITINKLTAELKRLQGDNSNEENTKGQKEVLTELKKLTKCTLCHAWLKRNDIYLHMCVQQQWLPCKYCSGTFKSTKKLLDHLVATDHEKKIQKDRENGRFFKCDQCSLGYPMLILLDCHKKSHMKANQKQLNKSNHQTETRTISTNLFDDIPGIVSKNCNLNCF